MRKMAGVSAPVALAALALAVGSTAQSPISANALGGQTSPCVAFDGTNYLVVWGDGPSGDIYAARVTRQGEVLDPGGFPVTTAPRTQSHPKVAFDGTNYLVAWTDDRNDVPSGNQDVYAARVTPSGTVLDPTGIPVVGGADYYESAGDVVFGGQNFLVVWNSSWRYPPYTMSVGATLIDRQGTVVRSASFESEGRYPVAAFDGTNYLAAWADVRNEWDVVVSRVSQAGDVLDPGGLDISNNMWFQSYPDLAFDGTNYLAVWEDGRNGGGPSKIYGTRVTPGAVALDPAGIPISTGFGGPFAPAVAFGGANFLGGWTDNRDFQGHLWGSRISPGGTVLDPDGFAFNTLGFDDRDLAIGFDGTNYLAVWTDNPNQDAEIYGTRIAQDGTILDPNRIHVSTDPPLPPPPPPPPAPPPPPPPPPPQPPPPPPPAEPPPPPRCRVPRLIGLPLARAKTRIRTNHCSVGSVRRIRVRRGRGTVVGQRPSAGAIRRPGFPVRLTVGRR